MTATRGTTNRNVRGSSTTRRRRREWLVETYRADVDCRSRTVLIQRPVRQDDPPGALLAFTRELRVDPVPRGEGQPACRCYRCGDLLTVDTVTADRIVPGIEGGTYKRNNIRPACLTCNSSTGGALGAARREGRRVA